MKWYQETKWIILMLVLCFPAGLVLMFRYSGWSKTGKAIAVIFVCFAVGLAGMQCFYPPKPAPAVQVSFAQKEEIVDVSGDAQRPYVASASGGKYHVRSCSFAGKIKTENMVFFSSAGDAEAQGYTPCDKCCKTE